MAAAECCPLSTVLKCIFVLLLLAVGINSHIGMMDMIGVPRMVVVPHDAPPGYFVHRVHCSGVRLKGDSYSNSFKLIHDGSLITVGNVSHLIDKPIALEVFDDLLPDVHLETLRVNVLNTNDLLRFSSHYSGKIRENAPLGKTVHGLTFITACAQTCKKPVTYKIASGNYGDAFKLKDINNQGKYGATLIVNGDIDRESRSMYKLTIIAQYEDHSDLTRIIIPIKVLDENDNAPYFQETLLNATLYTDVVSMTEVITVTAKDADENQQLQYYLEPENEFFFVAPRTGGIFVAAGVNEGVHRLDIYAVDNGNPPLTSLPAQVLVNVIQQPAHVQRIMDIVNSVEVSHSRLRRAATTLSTITIDVPEDKTGIIGMIPQRSENHRYQMEEENDFVSVDPTTGQINLNYNAKLDYETQKVHTFNVLVHDVNDDFFEQVQPVVLNVRDVNDEKPVFINTPRPFQTVVSANAPQGELVYVLKATDADKDADIRYKIELDLSSEDAFEVDEYNGNVRTRRPGQFRIPMEYALRVVAIDKNGVAFDKNGHRVPQKSDLETLSIIVGDRPPQFYSVDYYQTVPENAPSQSLSPIETDYQFSNNVQLSSSVTKVKAKSFSGKPIKYKVTTESGHTSDAFSIRKPLTGEVMLLKKLDFDDFNQPKTYRLQVHAEEEGGLSASTLLTVKVEDVNDNPPVFNLPEYVKENVDENLPVGSMILAVTATDADSFENGRITYELTDNQNFTIRNEDGAILSKRKLDYEIPGRKYEFRVTAWDSGDPQLKSEAVVRIFMKNQNDEAPRFSQNVYMTNVAEDAKPGALVTTLNAIDPDGDKVTYQFKDGQLVSREFKIDPNTGVLRLKDHDVHLVEPYYTLNVTAKDDGSCCPGESPEHYSEALVTVRVIDVNNNKPVFPNCSQYSPSVPENAAAGYNVIQVTATDDDTGDNGRVSYKIESRDTVAQEPFRIDEDTGLIKTRIPFDREERSERQITVTATDRAPRELIGVCTFTVRITDENDNEPKFSSTEYDVSVPERAETGRSFLRVAAQDADVGQNAEIEYSLNDNTGFFDINKQTGWVFVKRPLTMVTEVAAQAVATDKGVPPRSSTANIRIVITDRTGSSPPQWIGTPYPPVPISENKPIGSIIARVEAFSDYFNDKRVLYDIVPGSTGDKNSNHDFGIQPDFQNENVANIVVQRPLDYEKTPTYNLTLRAKNNAPVQLSNVTYLIINLKDENDNAPQFTLDPYPASVPEDSPIGTSVIQVKAEDLDSVGPNSKLTYEIKKDSTNHEWKAFSIDPDTGVVRTASMFDREKKQLYLIRVIAKDGAPSTWPNRPPGEPNEGGAYVRVKVEDVNDNVPYFDKRLYEAEVNEDAEKGTVVIEVTAKDNDEVTNMRYQLTTGNVGGVFDVNNETGEIRVQGELDYDEGIQVYNLTLVASDGKNENDTMVRIYVRDVNDNRPIFLTSNYEASIAEEQPLDELPKRILDVSATDKDRAPPDDIRYSLRGQGAGSIFTINAKTGQIYVNKPLNRDPPAGQEVYTLLTLATDDKGRGNYGYADVKIKLTDINDNDPVFEGNFEGTVDENEDPGKEVMRMTAVDYDAGDNALLSYRITENVIDDATGLNIFDINSKSGRITTRVGYLDRERIDQYKIVVEAKDAGGRTGTGTAIIHVGDKNDEKPEFVKKIYTATIAENLPKDTSVLSVSATDKDQDSKLRYFLNDEQGKRFFSLTDDPETNSAVLRIANDPPKPGQTGTGLDYEDESQRHLNLTIKVTDDMPSHSDFALVMITLTDYNDNPPDFLIKHQEKNVKEDVSPGTQLVQFRAQDKDSGINGKFRYEIDHASDSDPDELFHIDPEGVVYVNKSLDREKVQTHLVRILAIDEAYPYNTGTAQLTVTVEDINDNFPQFAEDYNFIVYENEKPPFQALSPLVSATDPDIGGAPFKMWSPKKNNPTREFFKVDFLQSKGGKDLTGAVRITPLQKFDREKQKQYFVPIVMADTGKPPQTGTNILTITIGDKNDNLHYPGTKDIFVYNYKNNIPQTPIGTVYAEDADDWDFKDKQFTIVGEEPTRFAVDEDSGQVIIQENTPEGKYSFQVEVYDTYHDHRIVSTVNVEVHAIWDDAVFNSGSVRISGITAEEFVSPGPGGVSKYELFREEVAKVTGARVDKVEVFSIMDKPVDKKEPPEIDVRFAASGSPYYKAVKLDGAVEANLVEIERNVGINITMVHIDECIKETCETGGCANRLRAFMEPTIVNSNKTSIVVVTTKVEAECICAAKDFSRVDTCNTPDAVLCGNGGTCTDSPNGIRCDCPRGFDGPQCQQTTRSFHGGGWAWFEPLQQCNSTRLSFEFVTEQPEALLLYNGPLRDSDGVEYVENDYIAVELINGRPRVTLDHGTGAITVSVKKSETLNNGEWHRLDIIIKNKRVMLVVDRCSKVSMSERGDYDKSICEATGKTPGRNKFLNVNTPLQLGGMSNPEVRYPRIKTRRGFSGCIKNVVQDGRMYDLGNPGSAQDSSPGCSRTDETCMARSLRCEHGTCVGSFRDAYCLCYPGYYGHSCEFEAEARLFEKDSFIHLQMKKLPLKKRKSTIHLMFRTKKPDGVLFRVAGARFDYMAVELEDSRVHFRYNLGSQNRVLSLNNVTISDGEWHTILVERFGSDVFMSLDGGGGRRQNETLGLLEHHRLIEIDQQEVYIGAEASITAITFESTGIYQIASAKKDFNGCIKDVRYDDFHLSISEANSQYSKITHEENIVDGCHDGNDCLAFPACTMPMHVCVDLWNLAECRCPSGFSQDEHSNCHDVDECLTSISNPCLNGGVCRNLLGDFTCDCIGGWEGKTCGIKREEVLLNLSTGALAAILVCLLLLLILVLVFILYNRRRTKEKYPYDIDPDDDIRENIINYQDEGGGEDDQDAYDISRLRKPVDPDMHSQNSTAKRPPPPPVAQRKDRPVQRAPPQNYPPGEHPDIEDFIKNRKDEADDDPGAPPRDDVRNYAYEGCGSTAGSLSSLASGTDDEDLEFEGLSNWGPRFHKLADMYGGDEE